MSTPLPALTDEIRLTQIPGELRRLRAEVEHFRQQHALEFTRAEEAERRAKAAEQRAADWQGIALHNGYEAADARLEAARERQGRESASVLWAQEVAGDAATIGKLRADLDLANDRTNDAICALQGVLDSIEYRARYNAQLRESVGNVLAEYPHLTERCEQCGGYDADYPDRVCEACYGGNVLREVVR